MKIVIACSKNWFSLDKDIFCKDEVIFIKEKKDLTLQFLRGVSPKFVFFPHWNWFVDEEIIENFDCILFHTAPLPFGRGGSPIQNLILEEVKETPVCALKMTKTLDAGPIYCKKIISLSGRLEEIFERLNLSINLLIKKIVKQKLIPVPQKGQVKVFSRLSELDNEIPKYLPINKLYDRIRMLDADFYPSAYINYGNARLEFSNITLEDDKIYCTTQIELK